MLNVQISLSVHTLASSLCVVYIHMFMYTFMQTHIYNCTFVLISVYPYDRHLMTWEEVEFFKMFNERHKTV